jgi:hypothetical protein
MSDRTAYRLIQEGLTNARRNAPGQPVTLTVSVNGADTALIEIRNPTMESISVPSNRGAGIIGMTERARLAGGRLDHGLENGVLSAGHAPAKAIRSGAVRVLIMMLDGVHGISVAGDAADGDEVMQLVDAHAPDVILIDIRMPKSTGSRHSVGCGGDQILPKSWSSPPSTPMIM